MAKAIHHGHIGPIQRQSEDEIRKWSTEENLPECRKASTLLCRGFGPQKVAVLASLSRLVADPDFPTVLEAMFVSLTQREVCSWDESLQIESGAGLLSALCVSTFPASSLEGVLKCTLAIFSTWSEEVHGVWCKVFAQALSLVSPTLVQKHCVGFVVRLGDFSQAVASRILATRLIGTVAECLRKEFKGDILQRALMMAQDTRFEIRKSMAAQMRKICRAVAEEYIGRVADEVLQLANDEEIEVQSEALLSLVDIIDLLSPHFLQENVLPLLRTCLFDQCDPVLKQQITHICGQVIVKVHAKLQDEDFLQQFLSFFCELATSDSEKDRKVAAYQFPGVISAVGEAVFSARLCDYYELLTRDESLEVRVTIASSFHEVVKLVPEESAALYDIFMKFIGEERLVLILASRLSDILSQLANDLSPSHTLAQLTGYFTPTRPWRQTDALLRQLHANLSLFPLIDIIDTLQPTLLSLYPKACLPVKYTIIAVLATIIHINFFSERRQELCMSMLLLLGKSRHYQDRVLFIEFCVKVLALNSRRFFQQTFYATLIRLAQDPVRNVRLKIALHFATFHACFYADEQMHAGLTDAMDRLVSDRDQEIAKLTKAVRDRAQRADYWSSIAPYEVKEREKQASEDEQVLCEQRVTLMQEREEAKRRLVQELTEKARMDYLQQYKDKKNSTGKSKAALKASATSARLPHIKTKDTNKPHSSSANTSPKLAPAVMKTVKPQTGKKK